MNLLKRLPLIESARAGCLNKKQADRIVRRQERSIAEKPPKIVKLNADVTAGLTLTKIAELLCEYAKQLNLAKNAGDGRHATCSHGVNALSSLADAEGVTLGVSAINGLLSDPPTQNPRMKSTLIPISKLLKKWDIKDPDSGRRIILSPEQLKSIHENTYSDLLDSRTRLRVSTTQLLESAKERQLAMVHAFLSSDGNVELGTANKDAFMSTQKKAFADANGSINLKSLIEGDDSRYVATRLHMIIMEDKAFSNVYDNEKYVRSLIEDMRVDLSDISEEEMDLKVNELARVIAAIEQNHFPEDNVESSEEVIVLLALCAKKPYPEAEEDKVKQFLDWLRIAG